MPMQDTSPRIIPLPPSPGNELTAQMAAMAEECIECSLCVQECAFLQRYGTPKQIAQEYDPAQPQDQKMPFQCSLCKLCGAVCPVGLAPGSMFLAMRREAMDRRMAKKNIYCSVLSYERRGVSKTFTFYALPPGCDTVFFPGCTLPGTRPSRVMHLIDHFQTLIPTLGVVLDCCTKPSHDLGRTEAFSTLFSEMKTFLLEKGVTTMLVACPNCYKVFSGYGGPLQVKTVYEVLADHPCPDVSKVSGTVTIHDPCVSRYNEDLHQAIRRLAASTGLTIEEMEHHSTRTLCCGEGGAVGCTSPELSGGWTKQRIDEADGRKILTYCAGCVNFLRHGARAFHILDLLCEPQKTMDGRTKIARFPFTYLNRWLLKRRLRHQFRDAVTRERTMHSSHLYR